MLESEARTKWCPFYRVSMSGLAVMDNRGTEYSVITSGGIRSGPPNDYSKCLGSDCALWVETDSEYHHGHCGMRR